MWLLRFALRLVATGNVISDAPGVGHYRECGIGSSGGRKRPTVNDKKIVYLVRLTPLVQYG